MHFFGTQLHNSDKKYTIQMKKRSAEELIAKLCSAAELFKKNSRVLIFVNKHTKQFSRVFNFAKSAKIREIRENLYPRKFLPLRY